MGEDAAEHILVAIGIAGIGLKIGHALVDDAEPLGIPPFSGITFAIGHHADIAVRHEVGGLAALDELNVRFSVLPAFNTERHFEFTTARKFTIIRTLAADGSCRRHPAAWSGRGQNPP